MPFIYILRSEVNPVKIYTGFTTNPARRLKEHNSGKSIYTNKYKPWGIICLVQIKDLEKAKEFERYLKTGSGIAFMRKHLIN